ncbi:MAG: hypothetical protein AAFQ98_22345 [Bacteroidota bacterium]
MSNACHISIDGTRQPKLEQALLGLSVTNTVETIPHALLEFKDGDPAMQDFKLSNQTWLTPGAQVVLSLGTKDDSVTPVFSGTVTHLRISAQNSGYFALEVECKHPAHRMTLGRKMRFFHNDVSSNDETVATISDAEALENLGREYGLTVSTATHPDSEYQKIVHENLPLYGGTDWDFLMMRADATGRLVRCQEGSIQLMIPDPAEAPDDQLTALVFGGAQANILDFKAEMDGSLHASEAVVNSWDIDEQRLQIEPNTERSWDTQTGLTVADLADAAGPEQAAEFHGGDLLKQEARALGLATMQRNTYEELSVPFLPQPIQANPITGLYGGITDDLHRGPDLGQGIALHSR